MYKEEIVKKTLSIKLFATLRQAINSEYISIDVDDHITALQLKNAIVDYFPEIKKLNVPFFVTKNCEFAKDSDVIQPTDEVALIPPVSGG